MWFQKLTGFREESPEQVRANLELKGKELTSKSNGETWRCGEFEMLSLQELRSQASELTSEGSLQLSELVGDVQTFHADPVNQNALFQAASQFNMLEMVWPHITPEMGIDRYGNDHTQGPACAIACGAGTIYRNYFVPIDHQIGQTTEIQLDGLEDIGRALGNHKQHHWKMVNGYALPHKEGLLQINAQLLQLENNEREKLKGKLKIGLQWNTEVTIAPKRQLVSQAYCSALPVAYSQISPVYWEPFASLVLEAAYEATLQAALLNQKKTGSSKVFLTLLGGGAFGNDDGWIKASLLRSLNLFRNTPLDVQIVSYGESNAVVRNVIENFKSPLTS